MRCIRIPWEIRWTAKLTFPKSKEVTDFYILYLYSHELLIGTQQQLFAAVSECYVSQNYAHERKQKVSLR